MHVFVYKEKNYKQTNAEKKCFLIIKKNTWITKQQQQLINFWFIAVRITEKDPLFAPRRCEQWENFAYSHRREAPPRCE